MITKREIKGRWNAELNAFWKEVLGFSVKAGSSAAGLIAANAAFGLTGIGVPAIVFTVAGYILTFCGAMGVTAKFTTE